MIADVDMRRILAELKEVGANTGTVFFVLAVQQDGTPGAEQIAFGTGASGNWPQLLRQVADEYERGFPKDCGLPGPGDETAFDRN